MSLWYRTIRAKAIDCSPEFQPSGQDLRELRHSHSGGIGLDLLRFLLYPSRKFIPQGVLALVISGFLAGITKLFYGIASDRTDWVVTNDLSQSSTGDTKKKYAVHWKIEQYHREVKQTLGIEKCQCRLARAQKNHIGYAILAWNRLTTLAREM